MQETSSSARPGRSLWVALGCSYLATPIAIILLNRTALLPIDMGVVLAAIAVFTIVSVVYISCGLALKQNLFFAVGLTVIVAILATAAWGLPLLVNAMFSKISFATAIDYFALGLPTIANFGLFLFALHYAFTRKREARILNR